MRKGVKRMKSLAFIEFTPYFKKYVFKMKKFACANYSEFNAHKVFTSTNSSLTQTGCAFALSGPTSKAFCR